MKTTMANVRRPRMARGRRPALVGLGALLLFASAGGAQTGPQTSASNDRTAVAKPQGDDAWDFRWREGFKLESPDGDFKLSFGGLIVLHFLFPDADQELEDRFGPLEDAGELRRARVFFSGTLYRRLELKMEFDFAGGDADPTDVYVGILDTPAGDVRLGHFKEPFSVEQATSSKFPTFVERALPNAFSPARNVGLMVHHAAKADESGRNERLWWGIGVFRESDGFGMSRGDRLNLTGRLAGLPIFADGGRRLLHLGLSLSHKEIDGERLALAQRPEANLLPRLVDVGALPADQADLGALEVAVNAGRYHAQGEYTWADVDAVAAGGLSFSGFYAQAGFFLTGEHRAYDHQRAAFGRLKPRSVFGKDGGRGAWEVAARYSTIDLSDGPVEGGVLDDWTVALNWYANPVTRFQLNYVASRLEDGGRVDSLLLGFQVDF